jgi:hypothetical protein
LPFWPLNAKSNFLEKMEMSEEEIKNEMRLYALEIVVSQLWAMTFRQLPPGAFEGTRAAWLGGARKHSFPDLDPAISDHLAGELENALMRLVGMMKSHLEAGKK